MKSYKDLDAWNAGVELNLFVSKEIRSLSEADQVNYGKQITRSLLKVPVSIAEGFTRSNPLRSIDAYEQCLLHLSELETELIVLNRLGIVPFSKTMQTMITKTRKLVYGLIRGRKNYMQKAATSGMPSTAPASKAS